MKQIVPMHLPLMRVQDLIVEELPDEVLVYDRVRDKAHCLNSTSAFVWKQCDGQLTAGQIAQRLTQRLQAPLNEEVVWLALSQLEKLHLLEQSISVPPQFLGLSRRRMIRNLGIAAAVALPLATSIVSPTPAQAATCAGTGEACGAGISCCGGSVCMPGPNPTCS